MTHPGGRPSVYSQDFCKNIVEFFNSHILDDKKKTAIAIPTKESWMRTIINPDTGLPISRQTFNVWVDEHEEFRDAVRTCEGIVKDILINNGATGIYNPNSFKFIATNLTDMRDQTQIQHSGDQDNPININLTLEKLFPVQTIE